MAHWLAHLPAAFEYKATLKEVNHAIKRGIK
jgi:hypothetical protein